VHQLQWRVKKRRKSNAGNEERVCDCVACLVKILNRAYVFVETRPKLRINLCDGKLI